MAERSVYTEYVEAFTIFDKYRDSAYPPSVSAEHDELFAGPPAWVVSMEDLAALEKLHWIPSEEGFHTFV